MNHENRIEANPAVMLGKPVIKGTRITVELILERLQAGETVEQIANSLKNIDLSDVYAAIEYAIDSEGYSGCPRKKKSGWFPTYSRSIRENSTAISLSSAKTRYGSKR